jgi:hypothetical protein
MVNLSVLAARTTTVLITGTLLTMTCAAVRAEPDDPAPNAPTNAAYAEPSRASAPDSAHAELSPPTIGNNSTVEPTFASETRRSVWPNKPLLATGATVFGISYLPAIAGAAFSDADGHKDLYIPVAGPWMMFASGAEESKGEKTLLIIDGVAQGVGALMLISSLFIPEKKTKHWYLIGANDTMLVPSRVATGFGVGASGRF